MPKSTVPSEQYVTTSPYHPGEWARDVAEEMPGSREFGELVETFRELQSALCAAAPSVELMAQLNREFRDATERLTEFRVPELERYPRRPDLTGRGHPVLIPYTVQELRDRDMVAVVEFTDAQLGGNGAVHGGTIPLLFDDLLGIFVSIKGQPGSRTAFLKVNYRKITPIHRKLRVEASIDRIDGRKTWITGRLLDGDGLLADAEALFLRLLPGQP
ncbi:PaaI family thioesterase [Rhodococcus sp. JVH1]|uniref:PaaI family thioesterase n=1 Tax=Rhodococcus sp. JVH1 TaxID=745408 RepID=UPI0002720224|nr:PaaI family thioesterase [Rhodococcus sp. JVH1]EJJ02424.1 thioesterase superfamily protein [Rhodococcus sp. JVH1]